MKFTQQLKQAVRDNTVVVRSSVRKSEMELESFAANQFKKLAKMNLSIPVKLYHL